MIFPPLLFTGELFSGKREPNLPLVLGPFVLLGVVRDFVAIRESVPPFEKVLSIQCTNAGQVAEICLRAASYSDGGRALNSSDQSVE
jgi:hypothetical protein